MAAELARRLASQDHQITVVTSFPNRPAGAVYAGYRRRPRSVETQGDVSVVRCATWLIGAKRRLWNRVMENLTFGISSVLNAWRLGRPDVLVLETWPLLAVQIGTWLGRWWRVPVVYCVQDVYPEAAEGAGLVQSRGLLSRFLRTWDRRLCLKSAKVQCCPGKVGPTDGKSLPLNALWPVLPGNDLKSRGRKWPPERSIPTRHNGG